MGVTDDRNDPRLTHGVDDERRPQAEMYLVLSDRERAMKFQRPYRDRYLHLACGAITTMGREIAETYAREPGFYGATYCVRCEKHLKVGVDGDFVWVAPDGTVLEEKVGT